MGSRRHTNPEMLTANLDGTRVHQAMSGLPLSAKPTTLGGIG